MILRNLIYVFLFLITFQPVYAVYVRVSHKATCDNPIKKEIISIPNNEINSATIYCKIVKDNQRAASNLLIGELSNVVNDIVLSVLSPIEIFPGTGNIIVPFTTTIVVEGNTITNSTDLTVNSNTVNLNNDIAISVLSPIEVFPGTGTIIISSETIVVDGNTITNSTDLNVNLNNDMAISLSPIEIFPGTGTITIPLTTTIVDGSTINNSTNLNVNPNREFIIDSQTANNLNLSQTQTIIVDSNLNISASPANNKVNAHSQSKGMNASVDTNTNIHTPNGNAYGNTAGVNTNINIHTPIVNPNGNTVGVNAKVTIPNSDIKANVGSTKIGIGR